MKIMIKVVKKLMVIGLVVFTIVNVPSVFGGEVLAKVRVFYRPDGGVSILSVPNGSCHTEETEDACLARAALDSLTTLEWPYEDLDRSQVPQDRTERNKWKGSKGKGIWIDYSLITKKEKIQELENRLDEELDKDSPDLTRLAKLERLIEKAKDMSNGALSSEELTQLEEKKNGFLATAVQAVGDFFSGILNGIKDGFLALRNLVIGTPEVPSGVTIYDVVTKQPYCSVVASGQTLNIPGACTPELIQNYLTPPASAPTPREPAIVPTDSGSGSTPPVTGGQVSSPNNNGALAPDTTVSPEPVEGQKSTDSATEPALESVPAPTEPAPSEPASAPIESMPEPASIP